MKAPQFLIATGLIRVLAICATVSLLAPCIRKSAAAQTPSPRVSLSFGVDTSIAQVRDIVHLTAAYLAHPDTSARSRGLWSEEGSNDPRFADLATKAYQGFPATILGVTGTGSGDSVFVVRLIHATADSSGTQIRPLALQRFYAIRAPAAPYGWVL